MLTVKHGGHRINLTVGGVATTTTVDDVFVYDLNASTYGNVDPTTEKVVAGWIYSSSALTGVTLTLLHLSKTGSTVDSITISNPTVNTTTDITTATAGTGNTLAQGWTMTPGDVVILRAAVTTTALGNGCGVTLWLGVPS